MVGRFKSNAPINNFILFVYALILKWPLFFHPHIPGVKKEDAFLYNSLLSFINPLGKEFPLVYGILVFALLFIQALFLNFIVINQKLFQKSNQLAGMIFILFSSLIDDFYLFSAPVICATFLLWILYKFSFLQQNQDSKKAVFDIGILLGLSILFYAPAFIFIIFIFYGLSVTRPFRLTEWILALLGLITPYYFLGAYIFISGKSNVQILPSINMILPHFNFSIWESIAIGLVFVSVLLGFVFSQNNIRRLLVQSRKTWSMIYFFLLLSLFVLFQVNSGFLLMAAPAAAIASAAFFYPEKKWFPTFIHWSLVILSVIIGYYYALH